MKKFIIALVLAPTIAWTLTASHARIPKSRMIEATRNASYIK